VDSYNWTEARTHSPDRALERDCVDRRRLVSGFVKRIFKRENILVLLLVIGALLGIVGVPQHLGITSEQILLALLAVFALDMLIERLGYLDRIEAQLVSIADKIEPQVSMDNLLRPRVAMPPFQLSLQYEEIWIAGKNLLGLLNYYEREIQQAAVDGKRFRFLIIHPDNASLASALAASSLAHPSASITAQHSQEALARFERIVGGAPQDAVEVRLADYIPPHSYQILDGRKPHGRMFVEMFGYKISSGERLHFCLARAKDSQAFNFHLVQFERMWEDATPFLGHQEPRD
jgi:hypothetical protein